MPRISAFYGIVVTMYHEDHAPPLFHVRYADERAVFQIDPTRQIKGRLSPRAQSLLIEWAILHRDALKDNSDRAQRNDDLQSIPPLN